MNINERLQMILDAGARGRFFTVKFIKRSNNQKRVMNCRLGVQKHLRGGEKSYSDSEKQLVTVYDLQAKGYRAIALEGLLEINGVPVPTE